jgi:hypothetical protein
LSVDLPSISRQSTLHMQKSMDSLCLRHSKLS